MNAYIFKEFFDEIFPLTVSPYFVQGEKKVFISFDFISFDSNISIIHYQVQSISDCLSCLFLYLLRPILAFSLLVPQYCIHSKLEFASTVLTIRITIFGEGKLNGLDSQFFPRKLFIKTSRGSKLQKFKNNLTA